MNIISSKQFDRQQLAKLFSLAGEFKERNSSYNYYNGKILATLFYEPSTRTRLSFESAMIKLGGNVISTENASQFSSAVKGESIQDTVRVVSSYADVIALRHPTEGTVQLAAEHSKVPIINAGDGCGEHPTQALLDVFTIINEHGRNPDGMNVCLVGDLRHGRTVHSLIYLLGLYEDITITAVSPDSMTLPGEVIKYIFEKKMGYVRTTELDDAIINRPDVVYMTRTQKERIKGECENTYSFTEKHVDLLNKDAIVMHPLPRNDELSVEVDKYKNAAYFRQAENGLWIRMAIIEWLLR